MIVEGHDPFGRAAQVGDDKVDAGIQFAGMSFGLGNDAAFPVPRSGLVAEAGMEPLDTLGRTPDRTAKQLGDAFLVTLVGRQADRIVNALGFEVFVQIRRGVRRVAAKVNPNLPAPCSV